MSPKTTTIEPAGDGRRFRVVIEPWVADRASFEALIPMDCTEGELYGFFAHIADLVKRQRETTKRERPPR